ncbi:heme-binding protein 2 [Siniperca chuatsi]|uniref:heme-binding protein 2 n=1 Tax=Siniperca chuatsi TaxID=119488 RepID=UPI001CE14959|nr:heme-binding protein 2 [Siniperca chuatsi]
MHGTQHSATMIYLSGLVGFLLVLTAEGRVGNSSQLQFCSETEQCLLFDLICETDQYEVRHYDSVRWVSTNETSYFMEIAAMRAFRRLYEYITGANENGKKIQMTAPVVVKMSDKKFWEMGVYTTSFLLPAEHQMNPPKPTNDKVYIHDMPDMKMYVRSYGGWMTSLSDKNKANSLSSALDSVGAKYKKGFHYAVGYNSPMTMFNRHNEVWFVAEDEPICTSSSEELEFSPFS